MSKSTTTKTCCHALDVMGRRCAIRMNCQHYANLLRSGSEKSDHIELKAEFKRVGEKTTCKNFIQKTEQ